MTQNISNETETEFISKISNVINILNEELYELENKQVKTRDKNCLNKIVNFNKKSMTLYSQCLNTARNNEEYWNCTMAAHNNYQKIFNYLKNQCSNKEELKAKIFLGWIFNCGSTLKCIQNNNQKGYKNLIKCIDDLISDMDKNMPPNKDFKK